MLRSGSTLLSLLLRSDVLFLKDPGRWDVGPALALGSESCLHLRSPKSLLQNTDLGVPSAVVTFPYAWTRGKGGAVDKYTLKMCLPPNTPLPVDSSGSEPLSKPKPLFAGVGEHSRDEAQRTHEFRTCVTLGVGCGGR